ncbi:MAG: helix-turn-helix domain-containing protein [Candidatus Diapherotrites archaeon]|nr:helix-turn-helix domain-containing protein [Candidatus Diapherotrites archaeon]
MPSKGPNKGKLSILIDFLKKHPEGVWVRELARKTSLDKSMVSRYLNDFLKEEVEFFFIGSAKMIKLRKKEK